MKINWGIGIATLYAGFVIGILTLVIMSSRQKVDLVTENYYEEELVYQQKIDKIERTKLLAQPLLWGVNQNGILLQFPDNMNDKEIGGKVKLYCPSDNGKDKEFVINLADDHSQLIPASQLSPGRYKLQVEWQTDSAKYWNEGVIVINP
jgi:hypothetical protein